MKTYPLNYSLARNVGDCIIILGNNKTFARFSNDFLHYWYIREHHIVNIDKSGMLNIIKK